MRMISYAVLYLVRFCAVPSAVPGDVPGPVLHLSFILLYAINTAAGKDNCRGKFLRCDRVNILLPKTSENERLPNAFYDINVGLSYRCSVKKQVLSLHASRFQGSCSLAKAT